MPDTSHRFVLRTIRDGRVRINGQTYRVRDDHRPYDGRLDGLRYLFGLYPPECEFVALWGTARAYEATKRGASQGMQDAYENGELDGPEVVDGTLPWLWWVLDA